MLGESVNNDEDSGEAGGLGKVFNEVHGDGIPRTRRNWELLNQTIRLVSQGLQPTTGRTRGAEVVDELPDFGPSILATYEFHSLVNPKVSSKEVIVFVLKDTQAEILCIRNVELSFIAQVAGFVSGPVSLGGNAGLQVFDDFLGESVTRQRGKDVGVDGRSIRKVDSTEKRFDEE